MYMYKKQVGNGPKTIRPMAAFKFMFQYYPLRSAGFLLGVRPIFLLAGRLSPGKLAFREKKARATHERLLRV